MKTRKTIEIKKMLEVGNRMLAYSKSTVESRDALCVLMESMLHCAEAYAGFRYLEYSSALDNIKTIDKSRREYYLHRGL
jgi:hypothetical protein